MMRTTGLILMGSLLLAGSATAQTTDLGGTSSYDGKHIEALFKAQDPSGATLTREQITAYRSESGWGKAFKQMQADGYYEGYKNLGQVISGSKAGKTTIKTDSAKIRSKKASGVKTHKVHKAQKSHRVTRVNRPNRPKRPKRR